jgi:hypothetical protein
MFKKTGLAALPLLLSASAIARPPVPASPCLNLVKAHSKATLSGALTIQIFAGPPNYESIAKGDTEERALILELPTRECANDGMFIEPSTKFDRVHLSSSVPAFLKVLNAAVGRKVTVRGEAFGSHTGHHHAPLVLFVEEVTVR